MDEIKETYGDEKFEHTETIIKLLRKQVSTREQKQKQKLEEEGLKKQDDLKHLKRQSALYIRPIGSLLDDDRRGNQTIGTPKKAQET